MTPQNTDSIAVIILAAGKSSRMGGPHKLLARFDGMPLVRRVTMEAIASSIGPVIVVTGHRRDEIEAALAALPVDIAFAEGYASGMSSSLAEGIRAAEALEVAGAMVVLADMPELDAQIISAVAFMFHSMGGGRIVRACAAGKSGHPTVFPRSLFAAIRNLKGDIGARELFRNPSLDVVTIDVGSPALRDVNTLADIHAAGGEVG